MYETTGTSLSVEAELEPGEDESAAAQALKQRLEALFWPLAMLDFQTYLTRVRMGTAQFMEQLRQGGWGGQ